jgi:N-acetylneuraminic acid mutarotase
LLVLFVAAACIGSAPDGGASSAGLTPRRALTAALLEDRIYAVGGWNGDATQLSTVETSDLTARKWQPGPSLEHARSQHAMVVADNSLWVIGGWSQTEGLIPHVEAIASKQPVWSTVTRLPTPRREPAAAVLGRDIYVVGGFNGASDAETDAYLGTVEAYGLDTKRWERRAPLRSPRRGLALLTDSTFLYAIGGFVAEQGFLGSVERYDPTRDAWEPLAWSIRPRTWTAFVNAGKDFLLIGGHNRDGFLDLIERIDPRTGRVCHPAPLRTARSWLAATVVDGQVLTIGGEQADGIGNTVERTAAECR